MEIPIDEAYWRLVEFEDSELRKVLLSSACSFFIDDGDETFFRYWMDGYLMIRTCLECKTSEAKSPKCGQWVMYLTADMLNQCHLDILNCSLCKKWGDRWREKNENEQ